MGEQKPKNKNPPRRAGFYPADLGKTRRESRASGQPRLSENQAPSQAETSFPLTGLFAPVSSLFRGGLSHQTEGETMPFSHKSIAAPTGSRRLTLTMLAARERADEFVGAAAGSARPFSYLAAFQEAEPYLGLPPQAYKLIAWLVKQTMPHDWEEGSRPICWPSAARQAEFLGLSPARVKVLNRALFEAGVVIVRDSETGKRYGRRGADGRIIEAYGFDLSPLAYRHDEFIRLAAEAKAERERMRALKKRATRARRGIRQLGETLAAVAPCPANGRALRPRRPNSSPRYGSPAGRRIWR
ncbi:hypothetical protein IY145_00200 [Methylosinus sp. H3A]|uniref:plasmid replication protein RepC n=1 Tax=Methylosinus sp. H3A TaxID=2785786 RepID=UPI0018C304B0|nr:plasmid replication protein RepC [Methylosinus sp. H3A]MBG0807869.1 hypothetical protein [Methylosinus sp. H3A]